jgi:hypothetical protein
MVAMLPVPIGQTEIRHGGIMVRFDVRVNRGADNSNLVGRDGGA